MQIHPSNKAVSIIGDIDFLLFGDSSTLNTRYSLTDRIRNINLAYDEAVTIMFTADPMFEWDDYSQSDLPFATTTLVSGQDHYDMPDSALVVHRVRIKDRNGKWVTLTPRLRSELTDSDLDTTENTGVPSEYYKIGGAIFPLPVPDYGVSGGVELAFQRAGNHFTISDTTASPGFNPQFHQFLSVSASLRYAIANGMDEKASQLREQKALIANAMREYYQTRSPDEKPQLRLKERNVRNYGF